MTFNTLPLKDFFNLSLIMVDISFMINLIQHHYKNVITMMMRVNRHRPTARHNLPSDVAFDLFNKYIGLISETQIIRLEFQLEELFRVEFDFEAECGRIHQHLFLWHQDINSSNYSSDDPFVQHNQLNVLLLFIDETQVLNPRLSFNALGRSRVMWGVRLR